MPSLKAQFAVRLTAQMFEFLNDTMTHSNTRTENQVHVYTCAVLMQFHSLNCITLTYNFSLYALIISQIILSFNLFSCQTSTECPACTI